jgi:excisionase family DNA binding protein
MTKVLLTAKEVADMLKLNVLTVYEYIRKSKLPAVKFGRSYRIEEKDLNKFIKEHKVKSK